MTDNSINIQVIGGGLAGTEATWQIAQAGIPVTLHEMRPLRHSPAHHSQELAELVCSNSFGAMASDLRFWPLARKQSIPLSSSHDVNRLK